MGNRANVVFVAGEHISPAIYLHWNGGPESVYAFLAELNRRNVRADGEYEAARFCQVVGDLFDDAQRTGLSLGITNGPKEITPEAIAEVHTDAGDNGFYIVNRTTDPMSMRRFRMRYDGKVTMVELSPAEVEAEWREARNDPYAREFEEFFLALDAKRYNGGSL